MIIIITIKYKLTIRYFSFYSKQTPLTFESTDTVASFYPDARPLKVFLLGDHDAQISNPRPSTGRGLPVPKKLRDSYCLLP